MSGQTTAILIVLMFGAGTDYCLLIVARFRDELRGTEDVGEAMVRATERTGPAILSAGAIVIVAMLVLVVADFNATREMGPILALGIAVMVAAGLTLLPAILATLGRRAFWPAVPQVEPDAAPVSPMWRRVGRLVGTRPAATAAAVTLVLVAGALGSLSGREALDFSEAFRDPPESVLGEQVIADRFIPGRAAPVSVVSDLRGRRPGDLGPHRWSHDSCTGDVRDGGFGAARRTGFRTDPVGGLPADGSFLRCGHRRGSRVAPRWRAQPRAIPSSWAAKCPRPTTHARR